MRQRNIKIPLRVWSFHGGVAEVLFVGFDSASLLLGDVVGLKWWELITQWRGVISPKKGNLKNPLWLIITKILQLQKKCVWHATFCMSCWTHSSLYRYLASKCMGYTHKYMWGPTCSLIICCCPIWAIIFGCSDKF